MDRTTHTPFSWGVCSPRLAWLLLPLFALIACGTPPPPEPPAPPSATYETRGIVRKLPDGLNGGELMVTHEAIPTFADQDGETVGMQAMTMPFLVTDPTHLANLAVGDRVAFSFGVRWQDGPPLEVLDVTPLAEGTRLDFEKDAEAPEEDPSMDEEPPTEKPN